MKGSLVHLAVDGVMPLWLAQRYDLPQGAGHLRWRWISPTLYARPVRLGVVAWSEEEAMLGPRSLRHGLMTAVVRHWLGAPVAWDSLAVRSSRRTVYGRAWAKREWGALRERGVPRPDAEWWPRPGFSPWAVEVDTGKLPAERVLGRLRKWHSTYGGVVWVVQSEARAREVQPLMEETLFSTVLPYRWRLLLLRRWHDGVEVEEVKSV